MLEAMMLARVGDDYYGEDLSVNELEEYAANLFGKEAAVFCPSGTMTNQIAIKLLCKPHEELICDRHAHIYLYEAGGIASNAMVSVKLIEGDRGRISAQQVRESINDSTSISSPLTTLVSVENTMNKGGGSIYSFQQMEEIAEVCREHGLNYHLDGARIFNAIAETGDDFRRVGQLFNTISICLSKSLGAPVGSLLIGNTDDIQQGRRLRKALGGQWRQAGYLAEAGLYALKNNTALLQEDHRRAKVLGEEVAKLPVVSNVMEVETNVVIFTLEDSVAPNSFSKKLEEQDVLAKPFGSHEVRFVTHLDFNDEMLDKTVSVLRELSL